MKNTVKKLVLWGSYFLTKKNYGSKILYYHDVYDQKCYTYMGTPFEMFKHHIATIEKEGFHVVDKIRNKDREVLICFDDGFRGIYDVKDFFIKKKIRPLIFLAVDLIGQKDYLTLGEILELQADGFQFGAHTSSHCKLTDIHDEDLLRHELLDARVYLSEKLNSNIDSICFPFGFFSDKVIEKSIAYGYTDLYSSLPGNFFSDDKLRIYNRILVQHSGVTDLKYRLLGNLAVLRKQSLKRYYQNSNPILNQST